MALMGVDPAGEVAIINIIGQIELSQLERLGEVLHIPHLSPSGMPAQAPQPSDEKGSDR